MNKSITDRERAVLRYAVAYNISNKVELYKLAFDGSLDSVEKIKHIESSASHWFKGKKIQEALEEERAAYRGKLEMLKEKIIEEFKAQTYSTTEGGRLIDYSNPANRMKRLNQIINRTEDVKDTLDAMKLIENSQKNSTETESGQKKQVQAYLPVKCKLCTLYQLGAWIAANPDVEEDLSDRLAMERSVSFMKKNDDPELAERIRMRIVEQSAFDAFSYIAEDMTQDERARLGSVFSQMETLFIDINRRNGIKDPDIAFIETLSGSMARKLSMRKEPLRHE